MNWIGKSIIITISIGVAVFSCKPKVSYTPTPYQVQLPSTLPTSMPSPANNPLTLEGIALGRKLFYDPILSDNNTQSCASCHNQKFAFTDSTNAFSKGITGAIGDRNSMPIFNLAWSSTLFWDGRANSLEEQALQPIENPKEMNSTVEKALEKLRGNATYQTLFEKAFGKNSITRENLARALSQFERTIISGNSKYDKYKRGEATLTQQELDGMALYEDMQKGDCFHCHTLGTTFTDFDFKNNGLDLVPTDSGRYNVTHMPNDIAKFKTPSLRNIVFTAPYMHDGRFSTLEQVLEFYNTGFHETPTLDVNMATKLKPSLNVVEQKAIIAFIKTLTDSSLITNPNYSNPN